MFGGANSKISDQVWKEVIKEVDENEDGEVKNYIFMIKNWLNL